jgi:Tfp pilus assembly protein PilZ
MIRRKCQRFNIPGTTLYYKKIPLFWGKKQYSEDYFPVLDISRGGLKFLCNDRIGPGESIVIKLNIPGSEAGVEIRAIVRWISRNREQSYRYQTGVSFNSYGTGKKDNPVDILSFLKALESAHQPTVSADENLSASTTGLI